MAMKCTACRNKIKRGKSYIAYARHRERETRRGTEVEDDVGGELADVAIYLLSLAAMTDHDLGAEIDAKMAVNRRRRYEATANGVMVRVSDPAGDVA